MSDMDPLYLSMKASAEDMSQAAVEQRSMMTGDINADVTIPGYGDMPSYAKQIKNRVGEMTRIYTSNTAAQTAITEGRIPEGYIVKVISGADNNLVLLFSNTAGALTPVLDNQGVQLSEPTAAAYNGLSGRIDDLEGLITENEQQDDQVVFTDPLGFSHSRIRKDGGFESPMVQLDLNEMSSGNLGIKNDPNFPDDQLLLSDQVGFTVPITGEDSGGGTDPGDVTVDLPPQTAAYGVLSKMRAALEDVCIIINSDSTGITQDTDPSTGTVFKKWTRKLAEFLAANYPAYTVNYYSWSSTAYNSPETIQVGTAGKTLHFYNAAVAGTQPLYLMGQYFDAAYAPRQADLLILNHGHNTDNNVPASTHMGMDLAVMYTMLQRHPNAGAIIVSQNPLRDNDNGTPRSAGARQAAIASGFSLVDVFQLFQNAGKPTGWYMDNIHPNATGDSKIFDLVKNLFVWPSGPSDHKAGLTAGINLLTNSDFAAWTGAAPDGWSLTGCTAEKDTTNFESGNYGMKLVRTDTIEAFASIPLPASLVKRLKGRTVVVSARVWVPTSSTRGNCGSVQIAEVTNNRPYGMPSGGRGGFVWKSTVVTIPTTVSALTVRAVLDTAGGAVGDTCTFDRLTLCVGTIPQDFY